MKNDKLNKHMSQEDRTIILEGLVKGLKLKEIADLIKKDPTTISKEIKQHRYEKGMNTFNMGSYGILCANLDTCKMKRLCQKTACDILCKRCRSVNCTTKCKDFKPRVCKNLVRFPFTCHSCKNKSGCRLNKFYYDPRLAETEYRDKLTKARQGINMSKEEFNKIDEIITDGIKRGLSIYAILKSHPEINCSERTIYRYVENKYLTAKSIDLRRKVTYKKRYKSKVNREANREARKNRLFTDYMKYMVEHSDILSWELDLVEGLKTDSHYIMTLHNPASNLMIGFIIPNKTPNSISEVFNKLEETLTLDVFKKVFPVILTDRGGEFSKPEDIEFSPNNGEQRAKLFYCDSYSSSQKAHIESNHRLIRYVISKGRSIDSFTQDNMNLLFSHINSYPRESKCGSKPYNIFKAIYSEEILKKIKISLIEYKDLNLTKTLI